MARTRVRWGRLGALAVLVSTVGALAGTALAGAPARIPMTGERRYTVRTGDTLWSIARLIVGDSGDPRSAVHELLQRNRITDGVIRAGETLLLPAP